MRRLFRLVFPGVLLILACLVVFRPAEHASLDGDHPVRIALMAPLTGDASTTGEMMTRTARMCLEELNAQGGVRGNRILLSIHDDANDPEQAEALARDLAGTDVHAVIGPWDSECALRAGRVYNAKSVPMVTPGAVSPLVADNRPWVFKTIYNSDLPGQFLATYMSRVFQADRASLIDEEAEYGASLAEAFANGCDANGIELANWWSVGEAPVPRERYDEIVDQLERAQDPGPVFLAVQATDAVQLVRRIRDRDLPVTLLGASSLAERTFVHGFDNLPRERLQPGHYTNDIFVTTPFIYDIASNRARQFREEFHERYGEDPDWGAAFTYDTLRLIVETLRVAGYHGEGLEEARDRLRGQLASMRSPVVGHEGITGILYFDADGNAQRPATLATYFKQHAVSASTQLHLVRDLDEIGDLQAALARGQVLEVQGSYLHRASVVFTGVELRRVHAIDLDAGTHRVEFDVWFRHEGDVVPEDVVFPTAIEPIDLHLSDHEEIGRLRYTRFRASGTFKIDALPLERRSTEHLLGLSFHHRELTRNNLIYVPDLRGLGIETATPDVDDIDARLIFREPGWQPRRVAFAEDVLDLPTRGELRHLGISATRVPFSRFSSCLVVAPDKLSMRGLVPLDQAPWLLLSAGALFFLHSLLFLRGTRRPAEGRFWGFRALLVLLFLLSLQELVLDLYRVRLSTASQEALERTFEILWWIVPAVLVCQAVERYAWLPLRRRSGSPVPNLIRYSVVTLVGLLTLFGIVAYVFDQSLVGLLVASGVIVVMIALVIQMNVLNIANNLEKSFKVGDWIKVGDQDEGQVVDITWRSTHLQRRDGSRLSVPNSTVARAPVLRWGGPESVYWLRPEIHVDPAQSPERVTKILEDAIRSLKDEVLQDPAPQVRFTGICEWAASYEVAFATRDYGQRPEVSEHVWHRIWQHLSRAGIQPAIRRQELHLFRGTHARGAAVASSPEVLLREIDIFQPFDDDARAALARQVSRLRLHAGDTVVRQGDSGDSLFIVVEGVVGIQVETPDGDTLEVARLGAGTFFGEQSLLTGNPRTATVICLAESVLYEVTKQDVAPLIEGNHDVAEGLGKVLTQRQMALHARVDKHTMTAEETQSLHQQLLGKIQHFFGF